MVERASASLTRQLLAAHHAGASPYGALRVEDRAAGSPIALRVEHVACGDAEATLALLSLECLSGSRAGPLGFVALEGDGMRGGFELGEEQKYVDATSRAAGWNVSRSGNGCAWGVYEARLAAPARAAPSTRSGATATGARSRSTSRWTPTSISTCRTSTHSRGIRLRARTSRLAR